MNRTKLNTVIDFVAFACFVFLTSTGVIMHYLLPPRSGGRLAIWGLDRHDWGTLHFWIAIFMFAVMTIHLFLHWRWISCAIKGQHSEYSGKRVAIGILGLLTILSLALAPLITGPEQTDDGRKFLHKQDSTLGERGQWRKTLPYE